MPSATFFEGASDFEISGGHFQNSSTTHHTDNRTHINTARGATTVTGVISPGGHTEITGGFYLGQGQLPVGQQPSYARPLPVNDSRTRLPAPGMGVNHADTNVNGASTQDINKARDRLLVELATAILRLQEPALAVLQALGAQGAEQIPAPAQSQSGTSAAIPTSAAIAAIASTVTSLPTTLASSASTPSFPSSTSISTGTETPWSVGSTASIPKSEKRKSPLRNLFKKKDDRRD